MSAKRIYDSNGKVVSRFSGLHKTHFLGENERSVEENRTKEELERLHNAIRYTQQFKAEEAKLRAESEEEVIVSEYDLNKMRKA